MEINYDKSVDALNFTLRSGVVAKTLEVAPEILLDLDKDGRPLSLEVIGVSEKIGKKNFSKVFVGKRAIRREVKINVKSYKSREVFKKLVN